MVVKKVSGVLSGQKEENQGTWWWNEEIQARKKKRVGKKWDKSRLEYKEI